jgi:hypothetical protein
MQPFSEPSCAGRGPIALSRPVIGVASGDLGLTNKRRRFLAAGDRLSEFTRRSEMLACSDRDEFRGIARPGALDGPRDVSLDLGRDSARDVSEVALASL